MIGFYILALAMAASMFFLVYAMIHYGHRINFRISLFLLVGTGTVLWSIVPRRDRFTPPGPRLNPAEQPELFKMISEVADATRLKIPSEIYLVPEINAWVANRGGVMGIGDRRIMGIGLPLLQILNVSQLKAVFAHEFGHYYGGDTKLGPWIYKTRVAISRTIENLSDHSTLMQLPFNLYGKLFLRITHAISRRQEIAADALASRIAGSDALIEGLKKIHGSSIAFDVFWRNELTPVLSAGFHPPVIEGFERYLTEPAIVRLMADVIDSELNEGSIHPYDTHPSLQLRIRAAVILPLGKKTEDDRPAISLIRNALSLEDQLFSVLAQLNRKSGYKSLSWDEIGPRVYIPMWRKYARDYMSQLSGITPDSFPELALNLDQFARKFRDKYTSDDRKSQAVSALGAALAVTLKTKGWQPHVHFHDDIFLQNNGSKIYPFKIIRELHEGKIQTEEWRQQCEAAGISGIDLVTVLGTPVDSQ